MKKQLLFSLIDNKWYELINGLLIGGVEQGLELSFSAWEVIPRIIPRQLIHTFYIKS